MANCKKCDGSIPGRIVIGDKIHKISTRRTLCLECSPFIPEKTKTIQFNNETVELLDDERQCLICGRVYKLINGKGKYSNKCWSCTVNHRRFAIVERARQLLGGKCEICGYDKCPRALVFHHKNPEEKLFTICSNTCRKWEVIEAEVRKCQLICNNCHAEIHYKEDNSKLRNPKFDIANPEQQHECVTCGKIFVAYSRAAKYCSKNCMATSRDSTIPTPGIKDHRVYRERTKICEFCNKEYESGNRFSKYCGYECSNKSQSKVEYKPSRDELEKEIATSNFCAIGRKYGVSDNAVRKWARKYGLID